MRKLSRWRKLGRQKTNGERFAIDKMLNKKSLIIIGIVIIIIFIIIRVCFIYTVNFNNFCDVKYGEDYFYNFARDYPSEVRKCVNVDEEGNIDEKFFTLNKYRDECVYPSFLDLRKWFSYCEPKEVQDR